MNKLLALLNEMLSTYTVAEQNELLIALFEALQQRRESGADNC